MSKFRYGCETYSWVMSGDKYLDKYPHICEIVKKAGFAGIETGAPIMRRYFEDASLMTEVLEKNSLQFAALGFSNQWRSSTMSNEERKLVEKAFDFVKSFPEPRITLGHQSPDRSNLAERQRNAIACVNEIGKRAVDRGIACTFHPTSGPTSIFRTPDDYKVMMDLLDTRIVGYCPDSGHVVNGGMDVYDIFSTYASVIRHVHLKNITVDKAWAPMGEGSIDFPRLLKILHDAGYRGWIDIEEESSAAKVDPDIATLENGRYLTNTLLPLGY